MPMLCRAILRWWNTQAQLRARRLQHGRNQDEELSDGIDVVCQTNGNGGETTSLAFLPDGKRLVSLSKNDTTSPIRLWNMENGQEIEPPMHIGSAVNTMAVSSDGKWIVSGGVDGNVAIWSTASFQKASESRGQHKRKITALDVSPDSSSPRVASASEDGVIRVWHVDSESRLWLGLSMLTNEDPPPVSCLRFSPAGGRIATSYSRSALCTIQIWHSWSGDQLESFSTDGQQTRSIAWSSDGKRLFAGGPHGSIRCFDIASRRRLARREDSRCDIITALYVSTTDQLLISASASARIIDIWNIKNPSVLEHIHSFRRSEVLSMAVSPHELHAIHASRDGKIYRRRLTKQIEKKHFFFPLIFPSGSSELELTCISNMVYALWKAEKLEEAEEMLSKEIEEVHGDSIPYARANRSLVRARLRRWDEALSDAEAAMASGARIPPIAFIAKGVALCKQEPHGGMAHVFDVLCNDDVESIIEHIKIKLSDFLQCIDLCFSMQKLASDVVSHLSKGDHKAALGLLISTSSTSLSQLLDVSQANAIFLISGYNVYDLHFMILQLKFQAYAVSGCIKEAKEMLKSCDINEEMETRKGIFGELSEKFGDKSMHNASFDDAIAWYTIALDLIGYTTSNLSKRCLEIFEEMNKALLQKDNTISLYMDMLSGQKQRAVGLHLKRSKAREEKKFFEEALGDVNEALQMDPHYEWAHERRSTLINIKHNHDYHAQNDLPDNILSKVKSCISRSQENNKSRHEIINDAIQQIANLCPLVLINVQDGCLYDAGQRKQVFEKDPVYDSLCLSNDQDIAEVVVYFFRYVMFSHRWGDDEPTFKDVRLVSNLPSSTGKPIYQLNDSVASNKKLRSFCETVKRYDEGYRWAWSDTCCIDKDVETTYKTSIRSMYSWYKWSALTLVLLTDVSDEEPRGLSEPGKQPKLGLKDSIWMTRAWTLQELLSPRVIHFYGMNWKRYRGDTGSNHKESPHILRELADAIRVSPDNLVCFSPNALGVREKLRLASNRSATHDEDIAYSLIGIFESDLVPEPRDPTIALGHLLEEIVRRYRETAVLDWIGESSKFHNCLPAHISVYGQTQSYMIPSVADADMKRRVKDLRVQVQDKDAIGKFYQKLSDLQPQLQFASRRLDLPCITFLVTGINRDRRQDQTHGLHTVHLSAPALGEVKVEFTASEKLPLQEDKLVLVYPWIRDLRVHAHLKKGDNDIQALRMLVYLEQPFKALLFKKHAVHDEYERIATQREIWVPKRKISCLEGMNAEKLAVHN